jgi:hypothetical protein
MTETDRALELRDRKVERLAVSSLNPYPANARSDLPHSQGADDWTRRGVSKVRDLSSCHREKVDFSDARIGNVRPRYNAAPSQELKRDWPRR